MDSGNVRNYKTFRLLKKALRQNPTFQKQFLSLSHSKEGKEELNAFTTVVVVDEDWLSMVEKKLPFVMAAVAEERQFVKTEGDVIPIERVRSVSKDSIVDLCRHANYLTHDPATTGGMVVPDKLLVARKENDYSVYENRFLYTLLCYMSDFMELRLNQILAIAGRYEGESVYVKHIEQGQDTLDFTMILKESRANDPLAQSSGESASAVRRISDCLSEVRMLLSTPLMKAVSKSPMVRVPVTKTNVIKFDTNFRESLVLFEYLHAYDKVGFSTKEERIHLAPFLQTKAEEDFASILHLDSFITYLYSTNLEKEFITLEEELDAEDARLAELEWKKRLDMARDAMATHREGPEAYVALLEEGKASMEHSLASKNAEITSLRLGQDSRVKEISRRFAEDMNAFEDYCKGEITSFTEFAKGQIQKAFEEKDEALASVEARVKEAEARKQLVIDEKDQTIAEQIKSIEEKDQTNASLHGTIAEKDAEIARLEAELEAYRAQLQLPARKDMTERDNFDELEERKKVFDADFEAEWKRVKKEIRRRAFKAPDPKARKRK